MAEENVQGQPEPQPVPEAQPTEGSAPTAEATAGKQAGVDLNELAKTVEELKGLKNLSGKWANEIGEIRSYVQTLAQRQAEAAQPARQPEPSGFDFDETEFLTKPKETLQRVLHAERERWSQEQSAREQQATVREAYSNFLQGISEAKKANPDLFDQDVEQNIVKSTYDMFRSGMINKADLRDPNLYRKAALMQLAADEKFDRLVPKKKNAPVTQTEVPSRGRGAAEEDEDEIVLDEDTRSQMRVQGITSDKEAVEIIKSELAAVRKGMHSRSK